LPSSSIPQTPSHKNPPANIITINIARLAIIFSSFNIEKFLAQKLQILQATPLADTALKIYILFARTFFPPINNQPIPSRF
jgi:hypothetical protein